MATFPFDRRIPERDIWLIDSFFCVCCFTPYRYFCHLTVDKFTTLTSVHIKVNRLRFISKHRHCLILTWCAKKSLNDWLYLIDIRFKNPRRGWNISFIWHHSYSFFLKTVQVLLQKRIPRMHWNFGTFYFEFYVFTLFLGLLQEISPSQRAIQMQSWR